ncbi:MAG: aminopeptidase [Phycisphaerae bacterium]|nr:aminopeptidase [Phycisphaerae bacterium]
MTQSAARLATSYKLGLMRNLHRPRVRIGYLISLTVCVAAATGCEVDYYAHLVFGQIESAARLQPINDAIGDPSLTQTERDRLVLVKNVRRFGIDVIGLAETDAYTVFDPNGTTPAAYVITASAKDRLAAYEWSFPFVGNAPYKGYFDLEMARTEARRLQDLDYDVQLGAAGGFSTLGILPDPVRQSNLAQDEIELAELILHEMLHSTIYKPGDADFNESLATFVGRAAAQRYFDTQFGENSAEAVAAALRFADKSVIDGFVVSLYDDAKAYYDAAATRNDDRATIIAGREEVFAASSAQYATEFEPRLNDPTRWEGLRTLTVNNATILSGVRYQSGLGIFADALAAAGGDFPTAIRVFSDAAGVPDSRNYIQNWIADR